MPTLALSHTRRIPDLSTKNFMMNHSTQDHVLLMTTLLQLSAFPNGVPVSMLRIKCSLEKTEFGKMMRSLNPPSKGDRSCRHAFTKHRVMKETFLSLTDHGLQLAMSTAHKLVQLKLGSDVYAHYLTLCTHHQKKLLFPTYQHLSTPGIINTLSIWYINEKGFINALLYLYAHPGEYIPLEVLWNLTKPDDDFYEGDNKRQDKLTTELHYLCHQRPGKQFTGKNRQFKLKVDCFSVTDHPHLPPTDVQIFNNTKAQRISKKAAQKVGILASLSEKHFPPELPEVFEVSILAVMLDALLERCAIRNPNLTTKQFPATDGTKWSAFSALRYANSILGGSPDDFNERKRKLHFPDKQPHTSAPLKDVLSYANSEYGISETMCNATLDQILSGNIPALPASGDCVLMLEIVDGESPSYFILWAPFFNPPNCRYPGGIMFPCRKGTAAHIRHFANDTKERFKKHLKKVLPLKPQALTGASASITMRNPTVRSARILQKPVINLKLPKVKLLCHVEKLHSLLCTYYHLPQLQEQVLHSLPGQPNADPALLNWRDHQSNPFSVLCLGYRILRNKSSEKEREAITSLHMSVDTALDEFSQEINSVQLTESNTLEQVICGDDSLGDTSPGDGKLFLVGVSCITGYNAGEQLASYHLTNARKTFWFLWLKRKVSPDLNPGSKLPCKGVILPDGRGEATEIGNLKCRDPGTNLNDERTRGILVNHIISDIMNPQNDSDTPPWIASRLNCEAIYSLELRDIVGISELSELESDLIDLCGHDPVLQEGNYPFAPSDKFSAFSAMQNAYQLLGTGATLMEECTVDGTSSLQEVLIFGRQHELFEFQHTDAVTSLTQIIQEPDSCIGPSDRSVVLLELKESTDKTDKSHFVLWAPCATPGPGGFMGGILSPVENSTAVQVRHYASPSTTINNTTQLSRLVGHLPIDPQQAAVVSAHFLFKRDDPLRSDIIGKLECVQSINKLCTALQKYIQGGEFPTSSFDSVAPKKQNGGGGDEEEDEEEGKHKALPWSGRTNPDPFAVVSIAYRTLWKGQSENEADKKTMPELHTRKVNFKAVQKAFADTIVFNPIEKDDLMLFLRKLVCAKRTNIADGAVYCIAVSFFSDYKMNAKRKTRWFVWVRNNKAGGILFPNANGQATKVPACIVNDSENIIISKEQVREMITHLVYPWNSGRPSSWIARRMKCEAIYRLKKEEPNPLAGEGN